MVDFVCENEMEVCQLAIKWYHIKKTPNESTAEGKSSNHQIDCKT